MGNSHAAPLAFVVTLALACAAGCTHAETFSAGIEALPQRTGVHEEDVAGEKALVVDKPDGAASGIIALSAPADEIWLRLLFPWVRGSDTVEVWLDGKSLGKLTTRNVDGLWDNGSIQVWHWRRLPCPGTGAGEHEITISAAGCTEQCVSRVVFTGGGNAWTKEWLSGPHAERLRTARAAVWEEGTTFKLEAEQATHKHGRRMELDNGMTVWLSGSQSGVAAVFDVAEARRAEVWVRLFFEAENVYEGWDLREMDPAALVEVDGELLRMHHVLDGWRWHWECSGTVDLSAGRHLLRVENKGCDLKLDKVVLYSGPDATSEEWYRERWQDCPHCAVTRYDEAQRLLGWRVFRESGAPPARVEGTRLIGQVLPSPPCPEYVSCPSPVEEAFPIEPVNRRSKSGFSETCGHSKFAVIVATTIASPRFFEIIFSASKFFIMIASPRCR